MSTQQDLSLNDRRPKLLSQIIGNQSLVSGYGNR